jgi:Mg-chelatase subunit ChlD
VNGFNWQNNATQITSSLARRGLDPLVGATRLSDGLDRAVQVLTGTSSQVHSNKVVILMTDGMWGDCRDPMLAAQDAAAAGVTVHCVSMLTGTQEILTRVANLTGGRYYPTSDANGLRNAFRELAQTIPIVLTE